VQLKTHNHRFWWFYADGDYFHALGPVAVATCFTPGFCVGKL